MSTMSVCQYVSQRRQLGPAACCTHRHMAAASGQRLALLRRHLGSLHPNERPSQLWLPWAAAAAVAAASDDELARLSDAVRAIRRLQHDTAAEADRASHVLSALRTEWAGLQGTVVPPPVLADAEKATRDISMLGAEAADTAEKLEAQLALLGRERSRAHVAIARQRMAYNSRHAPLVSLLQQLGGLPGQGGRQRSSVLGMLGLRQLWVCRAVCRAFRGWANNALAELPLVTLSQRIAHHQLRA